MLEQRLPVPAVANPVAIVELERFFQLASEMGRPLTMFSGYVDDAWHSLMKEPSRYEEFCARAVGKPVGHIPSGANNPLVQIEWLREYEAKHGKLPESWFADETGEVNRVLYDTYLQTGEILAAWGCTPSSGGVTR